MHPIFSRIRDMAYIYELLQEQLCIGRLVLNKLMYASIGFFVRILPRSKGVFVQGPCIHYNLYVVFILLP